MKRNALLAILVFCAFALSCGSNDSSTANRISRPGEYAGYGDAIYADEYEITSQYVQVSDGTRLAMDLYRPKDKATGNVITTPLPVLWMHTPYNRRYSNNKDADGRRLSGDGGEAGEIRVRGRHRRLPRPLCFLRT